MSPTDPALAAAELPTRPDCSHCGLPVPTALFREGDADQFCCQGCRLVWAVIHEHGLERYYDVAEQLGEPGQPARTTDADYEEFDDPTFHELYVTTGGNGLSSVELYLEGVHCAACVWLVERAPRLVAGAVEIRLDLRRSRARVTWDPAVTRLSTVARFLDSLGYPAHPFRGVRLDEMRRREDRALLARIAVAGAVAGNVMLISFALYGGWFHGIEAEYARLFRWSSLIVALPAVLWSAAVFYRGAFGSLRARRLHMDVPITIGIAAGVGHGVYNTIAGSGEIYFDSVTALIFLLLVGRWVQHRRQRVAADATELLFSLAPSSARAIEAEGVRNVPVEALTEGMLVEVRAGDSLPVDGLVVEGESSVDAALLTGESMPASVAPGSPVWAGTLNLGARLVVRVQAAGERTRVGRLMRLVEEGASRRAPVVQLADRISGFFVSAVLGLAALTVVIWWGAGAGVALDRAIALLIVTCPCALGLATPLAVSAAIGRAGRAGLLIRGGDSLERLASTGRAWLDKTGTLTEGRTTLVRAWGDADVRASVVALEAQSAHPVARAFLDAWDDGSPHLEADVDPARDPSGIRGRVAGRELAIGSPAFIRRHASERSHAAAAEVVRSFVDERLTPVLIAVDGEVRAAAGFGDRLRPEAAETVGKIERMGWEVGILSGDHPALVRSIGDRLGLGPDRSRGGVSPEDKLAEVERATKQGPVLMVGDGVNDTAALSAATVGVAVHGGAEAAMSVADVFLTRPGLEPLVRLLEGSRRTLGVIRWNLGVSLAYNVVGAALAMSGWIGPLVAAVMMPLSSLTVITLSYRARTFDPAPADSEGA
jgi:Cu2+-exporting ATPase